MAIVTLNRNAFEKEIGKLNDKMEEKISMFGTPVESVNSKEIQIEVFPNRPDLLSYQGFKRSFLAFLGKQTGIKRYSLKSGEKDFRVIVDSSVKNVRPYTSCVIVKGLNLNDKRIKEIIEIQEKIHLTIGRKRKKLAMGIYPLDKIKLPITFKAMNPEEIKFAPIDYQKEMSGKEILKKHSTGREYAHLLKGKEKFPIFVDSNNNILSMPPIINSNLTGRVTEETRDIFVECSGFNQEILRKCINIVSATLADMGGKIFCMEIKSGMKKEISPDFKTEEMKLSLDNVNKLLGLNLSESQVKTLVEKMGYDYNKSSSSVKIPHWRMDVLHEVDLIEDIAIAYGYENFSPEIPEISTIGQESPREIVKRRISEIFSGIGMLEVMNYHLTNKKNQFEKIGIQKKDFIELEESKTDYSLLRKDLSHVLLKVFSENSDSEYPQKIFETGKIFNLNNEKVVESESLAVAVSSGNFTDIKQTLEYFFRLIDLKIRIEECEEFSKYFIGGRVAKVVLEGKQIGFLGEIHPRILKNWKIKMPVALAEISLEEVFEKLIKE
jgi:phenylalanyl-tRNA synthetase beta chain